MKPASLMREICVFVIFCVAAVTALSAQTFRTVINFDGANGSAPQAALVQGTDGRYYGTTTAGGTGEHGTVFRLTSAGAISTVYSFSGSDGSLPEGTLVQSTDGNFYGTTFEGGVNGWGALYKVSALGVYTNLYSFDQTDGLFPGAGLIQASNGSFYGTTSGGGANNEGTIFGFAASSSKLTTLHSFCTLTNCADGQYSFGSLVQGTDQNFYGTSQFGGANNFGTVFKINSAGTLTTIYNFCSQTNCADGGNPYDGLIQGNDGNFYGTTYRDGVAGAAGTIFKITLAGKLTTLYTFCPGGDCATGANPIGGLLQGSDGNFYGTADAGGSGFGTLFQITPAGVLTTLHTFCSQTNCADGENPDASLMQATTGIFYGTTHSAGTGGAGTIFSLSMGLAPFVKTQPASGAVGAKVIILGNNLTGSTKVTFNGTTAVFKVVSNTEITATVPAGATTGTVQVTTPTKSLSSNSKFHVNP